MSTLHHEALMETCHDEAWENFRIHNKLTHEQLQELLSFSKGTFDAICSNAYKIFETRCI